jgi:hypothetical protein
MPELLFRITRGTFGSNVPGAITFDLEIEAGYWRPVEGKGEEWMGLSRSQHSMPSEIALKFFGEESTPGMGRMADMTEALAKYLNAVGAISGELVV